jgi:chromosomal replication initiation ATPase DnaA
LIKYLSDRQINIDKKLIEYIIKRIDRSYEKIFLFIHKVDKFSLKKGKPVDLITVKEALKK